MSPAAVSGAPLVVKQLKQAVICSFWEVFVLDSNLLHHCEARNDSEELPSYYCNNTYAGIRATL